MGEVKKLGVYFLGLFLILLFACWYGYSRVLKSIKNFEAKIWGVWSESIQGYYESFFRWVVPILHFATDTPMRRAIFPGYIYDRLTRGTKNGGFWANHTGFSHTIANASIVGAAPRTRTTTTPIARTRWSRLSRKRSTKWSPLGGRVRWSKLFFGF